MKLLSRLPKEHVFQESDSFTCGPCCLAMVYSYKGKKISLKDILNDFHHPEKGKPTYAPQLARHLNKNGVKTRLLTSTSHVLSPAWKNLPREEVIEQLKEWIALHPKNLWLMDAIHNLFFLQEGGNVEQVSYTAQTIREMLDRGSLVILCIDEDWVWEHRFKLDKSKTKRVPNEVEGEVEGHFVLVTKYNGDTFHVLDPFPTNLENRHGEYDINMNQLTNASLTWDAEVIEVLR